MEVGSSECAIFEILHVKYKLTFDKILHKRLNMYTIKAFVITISIV